MKKEVEMVKELDSFNIIYNLFKETLDLFSMVENGVKVFKKALTHFEI